MTKIETGDKKRKKKFLIRWLINTVAILIVAKLLKGIIIDGVVAAFAGAFIFGIINSFIRPALVILSFPLTILTLGLFTFVINGLMLLLSAAVIPGFVISGFWTAFLGAILISIFSAIISAILD